jgi:beta-N-acetylhexosaminidase
MPQQIGPVIIDLLSHDVSQEEHELIQHPLVGGIILFTRNFGSAKQIAELCRTIRKIRETPLLISVDQEGGRVQRFKNDFVRLPSMGEIGKLYHHSPEDGIKFAYCTGWIMAAELLAVGVDLSFAPVLDLDKKLNTVIADRAFDIKPSIVSLLAKTVMHAMHDAGMAATGKHFPGHGSVTVDSHIELPSDARKFATIYEDDMQPFIELINAGIDAMMPAHIIFSEVDDKQVGFSRYWLQEILRKKLNFSGVIFSDDLNMQGAEVGGSYADRASSALAAGCDFVLICNNRLGAINILDHLPQKTSVPIEKFNRLKGKCSHDLTSLHATDAWKNYINTFVQYRKVYENNQQN